MPHNLNFGLPLFKFWLKACLLTGLSINHVHVHVTNSRRDRMRLKWRGNWAWGQRDANMRRWCTVIKGYNWPKWKACSNPCSSDLVILLAWFLIKIWWIVVIYVNDSYCFVAVLSRSHWHWKRVACCVLWQLFWYLCPWCLVSGGMVKKCVRLCPVLDF